ncbi:DUF4214 domain-containing protein [uncultured Pseudomonas sp.]|uniref:DUF4214 domain-containing protein n=1 Tax=uncultured Pseudomonas sp. TaxID=114707 RepID=UPI00258AD25D|nr:DUF4214 domain-containing protein [uncultured Pseudomonas sp.]
MAITASQIQNLYIAYFGRPAEQAGLDYWSAQADLTVEGLSASFAQQPEYQAVYGDLPREEVVAQLYQNLFGRKAEGNELDYWIASDDISVDRMALALVNGAQSTDRELLDGKTEFAAAITAAQSDASDIASVKEAFTDAKLTITVEGTTYTLEQYAREVGSIGQFYQLAANQVAAVEPAPATPAPSTPAPSVPAADPYAYTFNGALGLQDGLGNSTAYVRLPEGTTTTTIQLNDAAGGARIQLMDALTSLTLQGTVSSAPNSNVYMLLTDMTYPQTLTELNVAISGGDRAVPTQLLLSSMYALTTVEAASSSASLYVAGDNLYSLSRLNAGSGDDLLTVRHGANDLVVEAGAGNDTVRVSDVYFATKPTQHTTSVTLGDGKDTFSLFTLSNLGSLYLDTPDSLAAANAALQQGLVKVTDFTAEDRLEFGMDYRGLSAGGQFVNQSDAQQQRIESAETLAEALQLAATNAAGDAELARSTAFQYHGSTYLFLDHALSSTVTAGDGLIELTGYTGPLNDSNFSFVADDDNPQYSIGSQGVVELSDGNPVSHLRLHAGVTNATIALQEAQGRTELTLDDASTLTSLTLSGTAASAGFQLTVSEDYIYTDQLASLTLKVNGGDTQIQIADMTALNRLDASASSANLKIGGYYQDLPSSLKTLLSGSGNDQLLLASGKNTLTVDAGAGDDTLILKGAAGQDLSADYGLSMTLGSGNDLLKLIGLSNLLGNFATGDADQVASANTAIGRGLIKVTDFSAADKLDASVVFADPTTGSLIRQSATQQDAVGNAASLAEALQLAASNVSGAEAHSTLFQFNGNTYLFIDHSAASAATAGDGLIELTGFTGALDSQNLIIAA